jgi:hypothetical protein
MLNPGKWLNNQEEADTLCIRREDEHKKCHQRHLQKQAIIWTLYFTLAANSGLSNTVI